MARAPVKHQQQQQQEEQQEQGGGVSGGGGGLSWFEASSLAWAASKAGRRAAVLTPALAEWVVEASSASSPQPPPRVREATAMLWAFAEQGPGALSAAGGRGGGEGAASAASSPAAAALTALCDVVAARLPEVEAPGDLASALWAVGRLGHLHPPLLRRVAEHLRRAPLVPDDGRGPHAPPPAEIVSSGGVSWRPLPGAPSAAAPSTATGPAPTARLLAMAAWAAARLLPGSLSDVTGDDASSSGPAGAAAAEAAAAAAAAAAEADGGGGKDAAASLSSSAEGGAAEAGAPAPAAPGPSPHAPLAAALLLPAAEALLRDPSAFSPQDAAGVAWAAARLGHRNAAWWRRAAEAAFPPARLVGGGFGAPQLTNVARAYARQCSAWGQRPPDGLMQGIARGAEARAGEFSAADASGVLRALAAAAAAGGGGGGAGDAALAAAALGAGRALVAALAGRADVAPHERKQLAGAAAAVGVADAELAGLLAGA